MGSSKKHKDREHKKKKKKRSRSRSRSRSRERRSRRDRDDIKKRRKELPKEFEDGEIDEEPGTTENCRKVDENLEQSNSVGDSSQSLSVEETNRLRAKLGLKPLEVTLILLVNKFIKNIRPISIATCKNDYSTC